MLQYCLNTMKKQLFTAALAAALLTAACNSQSTATYPGCDNTTDKNFTTPLLYSARKGDTNNVRCLLDAGVNANDAAKGWTPLMVAAQNGHTDIVQSLLDKGANVNAATKCVSIALLTRHLRRLRAGIRQLCGASECFTTALMTASQSGHIDAVRLLLEKGADVNAVDERGETALNRAKSYKHTEIVKLLRAAGAK